ncbi:MAG: hypothetical protein IPL33_00795 [Sphingobacteriales bacterium]|nr:hypothetical protein [Sphingobacteriales bacterium]MCC7222143.1 hypothetical protein [Chitinophagales bacterium]
MKYNPNITADLHACPQYQSIRLKGYNYSQAGLYFITLCCQNRAYLFGEPLRGEPRKGEPTYSPETTQERDKTA